MSLKERINKEYLEAFKGRDIFKKTVLSVIKGEIQTIEKNNKVDALSDEEITKILQKSVKSLNEMIKTGDEDSKKELEIINSYLPKQMSESEIEVKIKELISEGADNIGLIMKEFSKLPADRSLVSKIFNKLK